MASTTFAFAAPILPGKSEAWKAACAEISGSRKEEYLASRRALGITKEVACLQQTPQGDFAVVYIEAGVSDIMQRMLAATDSFSNWFSEAVLKEIHGIDRSGPMPPTPEVFFNIL